jgi:DNA cross-link repair 1B protein
MVTTDEVNEEKDNKYIIKVRMFDSNHCPGSVMILFEGYFGRILHTGDMRYCPAFKDYPISEQPLDELVYDNTYCDPIYSFCTRSQAALMAVEIIQKNRKKGQKVYLSLYNVGKEELLVVLAKYF